MSHFILLAQSFGTAHLFAFTEWLDGSALWYASTFLGGFWSTVDCGALRFLYDAVCACTEFTNIHAHAAYVSSGFTNTSAAVCILWMNESCGDVQCAVNASHVISDCRHGALHKVNMFANATVEVTR